MLSSAVLYFPFVWWINMTPRFEGSIFLLFLHFSSAYALRAQKQRLALSLFFLLILFTLMISLLLYVPYFHP